MSNEKEKEIDEFLNRFDEIKDTFKTSELKISDSAKQTENPSPVSNPSDIPEESGIMPGGRMERRLRTKAKNGLLSAKENLTNTYFSRNDTEESTSESIKSFEDLDSITENADRNNEVKMAAKKRKKSSSSKGDNSRKKKILKGILIGLLALALIGIIFLVTIIVTAEPINTENIYDRLSENSVMYDDEGNVIDSIVSLGGYRTNVSYNDLPQDLVDAIVAIEDKTFWTHNGFNFVRMVGAVKDSVLHGGSVGGTSTLTQQLARNIYLVEQKSIRTLDRKLREAYYAILLEKHLSKEQILEAYLNTIFLGFNTNGVQAASQAYFSKDVSELTLPECAALASLPQSPDRTALIKLIPIDQIESNNPNIVYKDDEYAYVYNDAFVDRKNLVLKFMKDQGKISEAEYTEAIAYDIRNSIAPGEDVTRNITSYFADFTINEVIEDLMETLNLSKEDATKKVYSGGLRIYTSMNSNMQGIVEKEFANNANFPRVVNLSKDSAGNILDSKRQVILYSYNTYFDSNGNFVLSPDEFNIKSDGSIVLLSGKRLNFYQVSGAGGTDVNIEFKDLYTQENGTFYGMKGGVVQVEAKYKSKDSNGNMVISPQLNIDSPNFIQRSGDNLVIGADKYTLAQKTVQPQSSMVIIDYKNGEIKAMVGGRGVEGRFLLNRAEKPRQPGSSMKPIGTYGPALQASVDQLNGGPQAVTDKSQVYGNYWTAASAINDAPIKLPSGKMWPKNWNNTYKGLTRMRTAIEQSINTTAVKTFNDIGAERAIKFAKGLGVTSIVETGTINDLNPSAMALGGMTYGISPLEMAGAYGTFANGGTYVSPSSYTKVTNKKGETILEARHESVQAMDKGVAFIMTDMLRTAVNAGIAGKAALPNQPVAGKTGTTNDNYDAWFVGYTPHLVGSVWIGNDVNIELSQGSIAATNVWARIMRQIHANMPAGKFVKPDNVISANVDAFNGHLPSGGGTISEYFVKGTQPSGRFKGSYPAGAGSAKPPEDPTEEPEEGTEGDGTTPPTTPSTPGDSLPPIIDSGDNVPPATNPGGDETPPTTPETPIIPTNPDNPPSWIGN